MKTLIIAPHIDDELIGCYSVLNAFSTHIDAANGTSSDTLDIFWLYDITPQRRDEGAAMARYFGCTGMICGIAAAKDLIATRKYDLVYVPARQDWHADHKRTNALFRQYATNFYSVDMVNGAPLPKEVSEHKLAMLEMFYPSQADLWENDASYYLFESITTTDVTAYSKLSYPLFTVTVPSMYYAAARIIAGTHQSVLSGTDSVAVSEVFNLLVAACPTGDVCYEHPNGNILKI